MAERSAKRFAEMPPSNVETVIPVDVVSEQVILAASLVDAEAFERAQQRIRPHHMARPEHQLAWEVMVEARRRQLDLDPASLRQLSGGKLDAGYLSQLAELRPEAPANFDFHIESLLWDHTRREVVAGPLASFIDAVTDPRSDPSLVESRAQQIALSLRGHADRRHLLDSELLARSQGAQIRARIGGHNLYPFAHPSARWGLDQYEDGKPRLVPGAERGYITVVTGLSGSGKSTFTAWLVLWLARQRRRVLYGAWEMKANVTLELLACLSLGYSRSALMTGDLTEVQATLLEDKMRAIGEYVTFLENPFRRRLRAGSSKEKPSNERNLDVVAGYIADSGCDVFVGDLFKRCFVSDKPDEEEQAVYETQAIVEELGVHAILVQQQRLKDIERRADRRPTREGIKGSGAWVEAADNILAVHRPALFKDIPDDTLEVAVLKQRYGKWPLAVEFDWDADRGAVVNGRSVPYDFQGGAAQDGPFALPEKRTKFGKRVR